MFIFRPKLMKDEQFGLTPIAQFSQFQTGRHTELTAVLHSGGAAYPSVVLILRHTPALVTSLEM